MQILIICGILSFVLGVLILFKQNFAATLETGGKIFFSIFFCAFLPRAWGTLDSGIAVQSYTGIQMLIIWTLGLQSNPTQAYKCGSLGLQSMAQTSTAAFWPLLQLQCPTSPFPPSWGRRPCSLKCE